MEDNINNLNIDDLLQKINSPEMSDTIKNLLGSLSSNNDSENSQDFSSLLTSLTGSINTMNGEFYSHIHMSCGDEQGHVVGGHLNKAIISATCEMFINIIDGEVDRFKDDITGLNLFKFN